MKKLLITLVVSLSLGTAVAKNSNEFVLKKATPIFNLIDSTPHINSGYQCEQTCWETNRQCITSGENESYCIQQFIQCIDTCEGAGGLYQ